MISQTENLNRMVRTDKEGRYAFQVGPGDYYIGYISDMIHSDKGPVVTVKSEKEILRDFTVDSPSMGVTGAVAWAHQGEVYDGATIYSACEYCHAPMVAWPSK